MPIPFAQLPTFAELKSILISEYGCEPKEITVHLDDVNDSYSVPYFERKMGGGGILDCAIVFPEDESERVALSHLRSICVRLEIPLSRFHLNPDPSEDD